MGFLRREDVLAAKLRFEDVEVPEWGGGVVRVWELSAAQRVAFESGVGEGEQKDGMVRLLSACLGDEAGPFQPPLGVEELRALSAIALLRLSLPATRLNTMTKAAAEEQLGN